MFSCFRVGHGDERGDEVSTRFGWIINSIRGLIYGTILHLKKILMRRMI